MKQQYEITDEELMDLLKASEPVPYITNSEGTPLFGTPQENANRAWANLGAKYGFIFETVEPVEGCTDRKKFLAEKIPPQHFTRHILGEFDDVTKIQRCIICGEVIADYSHGAWHGEGGPPRGWREGEFFMTGKNPTYMTTTINSWDTFDDCKKAD